MLCRPVLPMPAGVADAGLNCRCRLVRPMPARIAACHASVFAFLCYSVPVLRELFASVLGVYHLTDIFIFRSVAARGKP